MVFLSNMVALTLVRTITQGSYSCHSSWNPLLSWFLQCRTPPSHFFLYFLHCFCSYCLVLLFCRSSGRDLIFGWLSRQYTMKTSLSHSPVSPLCWLLPVFPSHCCFSPALYLLGSCCYFIPLPFALNLNCIFILQPTSMSWELWTPLNISHDESSQESPGAC